MSPLETSNTTPIHIQLYKINAWTNRKLSTVNLKLTTIINSNKTTFSQYLRNEPKDAPRGEIRNLKERHKNWDKVKKHSRFLCDVILGIVTVWRFLSSLWCVYGCQINPPLLSICIAQCFLHDVNYGPIVSQYSVVRFRSKSLLIFLCQSVTCQQTTFAYLDEGVEYVDTALDYVNVLKRRADFIITVTVTSLSLSTVHLDVDAY